MAVSGLEEMVPVDAIEDVHAVLLDTLVPWQHHQHVAIAREPPGLDPHTGFRVSVQRDAFNGNLGLLIVIIDFNTCW